MTDNKPVHSISYGTLQVTIWKQKSELDDSIFFRVCFNRIFKDNDTWGRSKYFLENDLPLLSKAILDSHTWIQNIKKNFDCGAKLPVIAETENKSGSENEEETI